MIQSPGYGRFKFINSILFIIFGALIIVEMARGIGLHFEAFSGYVLGIAMIALGVFRLRMHLRGPRK